MKKFSIGMFVILILAVLAALGYIPEISANKPASVTVAVVQEAPTSVAPGDMVVFEDKVYYVTGKVGDMLHAVDLASNGTATLYPKDFPPGMLIVKESDERNQQVYALRAVKHKYEFVRR